MIRSALAFVAAAWFAINAASFLPTPSVQVNAGQLGGIDGDPGAVAVTWAARTLFAGLTVLALAIVEWSAIAAFLRDQMPTSGAPATSPTP